MRSAPDDESTAVPVLAVFTSVFLSSDEPEPADAEVDVHEDEKSDSAPGSRVSNQEKDQYPPQGQSEGAPGPPERAKG